MNAGGSSSVWPALRLARPGTSPTPWACTATCAPPCRTCTRRRAWTRSSGGWRCAPPSSRRSEVFTSDPLGIDGRSAVELVQMLRDDVLRDRVTDVLVAEMGGYADADLGNAPYILRWLILSQHVLVTVGD